MKRINILITTLALVMGTSMATAHNHTERGSDGELTPKAECWLAWFESDATVACGIPEIEVADKNKCHIKVECFNDHVWPTPPRIANDLKPMKPKKVRKLKNCSGVVKKKC